MSDFFEDVFSAYCGPRECKECPLSRETSKDCRDLFARKMKAWAATQVEMAAAETTTPTAADTDVGIKWPKWVKEGAWVVASSDITGESFLGEIVEVTNVAFHVLLCEKQLVFSYGPESTCDVSPVRFEPYKYKEAKRLIGKVMEMEGYGEESRFMQTVMINHVDSDGDRIWINGFSHDVLVDRNAKIDGVPIGVPNVDYEVMEGGEA